MTSFSSRTEDLANNCESFSRQPLGPTVRPPGPGPRVVRPSVRIGHTDRCLVGGVETCPSDMKYRPALCDCHTKTVEGCDNLCFLTSAAHSNVSFDVCFSDPQTAVVAMRSPTQTRVLWVGIALASILAIALALVVWRNRQTSK